MFITFQYSTSQLYCINASLVQPNKLHELNCAGNYLHTGLVKLEIQSDIGSVHISGRRVCLAAFRNVQHTCESGHHETGNPHLVRDDVTWLVLIYSLKTEKKLHIYSRNETAEY